MIGPIDPDAEARPGKRLAPDDLAREAQSAPHPADLVLEELPQRLEQLQLHPRRQPADVVVALDQGGRIVAYRDALDDVGIKRSLGEKVGVPDLLQGLLEHLDEGLADDLALLLGLIDPLEHAQEQGRGVDDPQVDLEMPLVERLDRLALVLAQEPVVNEHARELAADRPVDQRGGHRGVDAPGKPQDDPGLRRRRRGSPAPRAR